MKLNPLLIHLVLEQMKSGNIVTRTGSEFHKKSMQDRFRFFRSASQKIEPKKKYCQNRMIFTKPGIYAATVILLDPLMSACNVRYSFIVKVMGKSLFMTHKIL